MLLDIFSSLDFQFSKLTILSYCVWVVGVLWLGVMMFSYYLYKNTMNYIFILLGNSFSTNLESPKNSVFRHVFVLVFSFSFLMIFIKFWSLVPYVYGITTNLVVGFTFGLSYWLMLQLSSLENSVNQYVSHFAVHGTPIPLAVGLTYMELVTSFVRPMTLTLRLVMNVSIGHVMFSLLGLMGSKMIFKNFWVSLLVLCVVMFFFVVELFVGIIQSAVFGLLSMNFLGDHS